MTFSGLLLVWSLSALTKAIAKSLLNKPVARRECGAINGACPSRAQELRAQERLIEMGLMGGLIDCFLIFFLVAHSPDGLGPELMLARMMLRSTHRPQALGMSGIGVDLDLGLRLIIEAKFGMPIDELFQGFDLPNDTWMGPWTHEQARTTPRARTTHPRTHAPTRPRAHAPTDTPTYQCAPRFYASCYATGSRCTRSRGSLSYGPLASLVW